MQTTKLIVHIGYGKAGSGSIQASLEAGSVTLREKGALFLGPMLENGRNSPRQSWQNRSASEEFFRRTAPQEANEALFAVLNQQLEAAQEDGYSVAIWSNDCLLEYPAHTLPALSELQAKGYLIDVQCYVRRHDAWALRVYTQEGIRSNAQTGEPQPFRDWLACCKDGKAPRFHAALAPWHAAFRQNFRLFNFDTKPDVVQHFLATNGLPDLPAVTEDTAPSPEDLATWVLFTLRSATTPPPFRFEDILESAKAIPDALLRQAALKNLMPSDADLERVRRDAEPDRNLVNDLLAENNEEPLSFEQPVQTCGSPDPEHWRRLLAKAFVALQDRVDVLADPIGNDTAQDPAELAQDKDPRLSEPTREPDEQDATPNAVIEERTKLLADQGTLYTRLVATSTERDRLANDVAALQLELARARRRPWKQLRNYLKFWILDRLSRQSPPIPARMAAKFAKSARKRDPDRSLPQRQNPDRVEGVNVATLSGKELSGRACFDPEKPNLLMVSHDGSRSGAPIVVYNLVQTLADRYNITVLCLRGGELVENFRDIATRVHIGNGLHADPIQYREIVNRICRERPYAFAVVNSVESRAVLKCLRDADVPAVALIHEFAANTYSKLAFRDVFDWSEEAVFSSRLTLENALQTGPFESEPLLNVFPQGKCVVPAGRISDAEQVAEREWLRHQLRPEGETHRRFVVIGAGMVQLRKGVDLFIETAKRVIDQPGGAHAYFFWIGGNYDPEKDMAYSVYLHDQMTRAGISDRVVMLRATSEIELAYELADVFLLPSRLDPLPNVAIDSLVQGLPVVCFEDATGIADVLIQAGLKQACVADYMDTHDLADKVLAFARSQAHLTDVSTRSRDFAARTFDFKSYATRIEKLGLDASVRLSNRAADVATILEAGTFRPDFHCRPGDMTPVSAEMIRTYAASFASCRGLRKPEPGFNPLVYAEANGLRTSEPYADFLRKGRPAGPWMARVIEPGAATAGSDDETGLKVALHVHAYFTDQLGDILTRLHLNQTRPDLFVSVGSQAGYNEAQRILENYQGRVAALRIVPNVGRDIGPLLTTFGKELVKDYDLVGHVHLKKSAHLAGSDMVANWITFLFENVLGGQLGGAMLDRIVAEASRNDRLGLVYPDDPHVLGWTMNRQFARDLGTRLGHPDLPSAINFPMGTMFWMRSAVLEKFTDLGLEYSDYPAEPLPVDGSMLHGLERMFGVVPVLEGWQVAVTNIPGLTR